MRIVFLYLVLCLPVVAAAEMYRWVDAQGQVHYSDSPPPAGAKAAKTIDVPPPAAPSSSTSAKPKSWQEKDLEFRQRRAAEAEAQAKKDKEAKEKQQNCETARRNLAKFENATRVVTTNEKGETVYMDNAARAAAAAEARKQIDTWCK